VIVISEKLGFAMSREEDNGEGGEGTQLGIMNEEWRALTRHLLLLRPIDAQ